MKHQLEVVRRRITRACEVSGRHETDITLVAVSKKQPVAKVQEAYDLGLRHFGENYLQELREKQAQLPKDICWHYIGDVQSRKVPIISEHASIVHSTDRTSQLKKWSRLETDRPRLLLQVNLAREASKSGIEVNEIESWCANFKDADVLLSGLMVFPPYVPDPEMNRKYFAHAREIQSKIRAYRDPMLPCEMLSMGVSHDFEVAIEEGATHIRIGSLIFGERQGTTS